MSGPRRRVLRFLSEHGAFLVLLLAGGAVRGLVVHAYVPAFWFPDSITYLEVAETGEAQVHRPWGYSWLLALLERWVPFEAVVVVQHGLGLLATSLAYLLLAHRGVGRVVRTLAVVPLALDGYLVQIEHYVLAESLYVFLLVGALTLLLWRERPPWWAATGAGVLLGAGMLTRTVGTFVLAAVGLYLLVLLFRRRLGWLSLAGAGLGVAAVVVPYVLWFHSATGQYAVTGFTGHFLYGRVSTFADCERLDVPSGLEALCPDQPVETRPNPDFYVWHPDSPANSGRYTEDDLTEFSLLVIRGQPLDLLRTTAASVLQYALPRGGLDRFDTCPGFWEFPEDAQRYRQFRCEAQLAPQGFRSELALSFDRPAVARRLVTYQDWVHVPGPVLGALFLVAISGVVPHPRRGSGRDVLDAVLCAVVALVLVGVPSATAVFDYRYGLPVLAVLPLGAALAVRGWRGGRSAPAAQGSPGARGAVSPPSPGEDLLARPRSTA
ncbi:phospholipid carrier-dependent glycosyltransferase [Geodermatophilus sp. SYSU D00691]